MVASANRRYLLQTIARSARAIHAAFSAQVQQHDEWRYHLVQQVVAARQLHALLAHSALVSASMEASIQLDHLAQQIITMSELAVKTSRAPNDDRGLWEHTPLYKVLTWRESSFRSVLRCSRSFFFDKLVPELQPYLQS